MAPTPPLTHRARAEAREVGVRHGGDGHRNRLHVALARLGGRHDRFLDDRDAKREGGGDPSGGWHVHRTTRPLESDEFGGDLVVAFGKVRKREVASGAVVGRAIDDPPDRDANTGQRRTGLIGDRTRQRRLWTARPRTQPRTVAPGPRRSTQSATHPRCISSSLRCSTVTSDGDAPCWRRCLDAVRRRARLSLRPGRS